MPGRRVLSYPARLLALALTVAFAMIAHSSVDAQGSDGAVRLLPPLSTIDVEDGPFTVFVAIDGLQHRGSLQYDDDRDTVPDREVESLGLGAFEFALSYDEAMLEVVEVVPALRGLERTGREFQCLDARRDIGLITFGCISTGPEPPGAQGTLTLASVVFRPLTPGASPLLLEAEIAGPLGTGAESLDIVGGVARVQSKKANAGGTDVVTPAASLDEPEAPTAIDDDRTAVAPSDEPTGGEGQARGVPGGQAVPDGSGRTPVAAAAQGAPGGAEPASEGDDGSASPWRLWGLGFAIGGTLIVLGLGAGATMWLRQRQGRTTGW